MLAIIAIILQVSLIKLEVVVSTIGSTFKPTTFNISFALITTLIIFLSCILSFSLSSLIFRYIDGTVDSVTPLIAYDYVQMPFLSKYFLPHMPKQFMSALDDDESLLLFLLSPLSSFGDLTNMIGSMS